MVVGLGNRKGMVVVTCVIFKNLWEEFNIPVKAVISFICGILESQIL